MSGFAHKYASAPRRAVELQLWTEFVPHEIGRMPELTCAAYEPRFQLIGVGTSDGRVLAINARHGIQVSAPSVRKPICGIVSYLNTLSFLAVSSTGIQARHINRFVPEPACLAFTGHSFVVNRSTISH